MSDHLPIHINRLWYVHHFMLRPFTIRPGNCLRHYLSAYQCLLARYQAVGSHRRSTEPFRRCQ
ncbi:MAG: hypothetical protein UZ03_NOB001003295 [Nitrospira sp. OLB3]|nr:MAG: hypothetical protein UZ03_NOB001003295 [Nitrospira sp. OLB3]